MFDITGLGWKRVVMIAAHTDDEMICAGTLHRLARSGVEVCMVAAATCATAKDRKGQSLSEQDRCLAEWGKSLDLIGVPRDHDCRYFLDIRPSCDFQPHRQEICQKVYDYVERLKPDACIILSPEDENTAHRIMGEECERVMRGRVPVTFRCHFPWNFGLGRPNFYALLDGEDMEAKEKVIDCYQSQQFRYNFKEMLLSYARADGLSVKAAAAERFEIVRWIL